MFNSVQTLVLGNIRSACTNDTLLHLCVSRLNVIKSSYFQYENNTRVRNEIRLSGLCCFSSKFSQLKQVVFPNIEVAKLLIDCGADVNAQNESKSTPLHVSSIAYNYDGTVRHRYARYPCSIVFTPSKFKNQFFVANSNSTRCRCSFGSTE